MNMFTSFPKLLSMEWNAKCYKGSNLEGVSVLSHSLRGASVMWIII